MSTFWDEIGDGRPVLDAMRELDRLAGGVETAVDALLRIARIVRAGLPPEDQAATPLNTSTDSFAFHAKWLEHERRPLLPPQLRSDHVAVVRLAMQTAAENLELTASGSDLANPRSARTYLAFMHQSACARRVRGFRFAA